MIKYHKSKSFNWYPWIYNYMFTLQRKLITMIQCNSVIVLTIGNLTISKLKAWNANRYYEERKIFKNISSSSIVPLYILVNLRILKHNKAATLYPINSYPFNIFTTFTHVYRCIHAFICAHLRYSFPKNSIHKEKQQNTFIPVIFHGRLPSTLMSHSAARISLSLSHLSRISYERTHTNRSVFSPR